MTCNHCNIEYPSGTTACPRCGATLVQPEAPRFQTASPQFQTASPGAESVGYDLGTTLSVSGATSVRSHLRPRTMGEIFSESWRLYREHWSVFWLVVLTVMAPVALVQILLAEMLRGQTTEMIRTHSFTAFNPLTILVYLVVLIASYLPSFALTRAVSNSYLGRRVSLGEIATPNSRFWGFVGVNLLTIPIIFGVMALGAGITTGVCVGLAQVTNPLVAILPGMAGGIATIIAGFLAGVWCWVAGPIAVVEGRGAGASLGRSRELLKGFYRAGFNVMLGAAIIFGFACIVVVLPLSLLGSPFMMPHFETVNGVMVAIPNTSAIAPIIQQIINLAGLMVAMPLLILPLVLFYYDLRIRKEGFDLQMLAEQLGYGVGSTD